jgi:hypothetical protein
MEYFDLLLLQNYTFLTTMTNLRDIGCSYLRSPLSLEKNAKVICKSIYRQLTDKANIEKTLYKLTAQELSFIEKIVNSGKVQKNTPKKILHFGFFLKKINSDLVVFHENFEKIFNKTVKTLKQHTSITVEKEKTAADYISYALYAIIVNATKMGQIKCLANAKPGIRMFDHISSKLAYPITKDFLCDFFNFLETSGLINFKENNSKPSSDNNLESRAIFYTNYFKYLNSKINDNEFNNLKASFLSDKKTIAYKKEKISINQKILKILELSDFIKTIDNQHFVLTDLARQFLSHNKVQNINRLDNFYILPGFNLLLERNINETVLSFVINIATIIKFDVVFNIQLTTKSLIKAIKNNYSSTAIIDFLHKYCKDVPHDLILMIKDSYERYGEVKIFSKYNVIITDNPHIKEQILNIKEISKYIVYKNETAIVLEKSKKPSDIKHILIDNNLIPQYLENKQYFDIKSEDIKNTIDLLTTIKLSVKKENEALCENIDNLIDKLTVKTENKAKNKKPAPKSKPKETNKEENNVDIVTTNSQSLTQKLDILNFAIGKKYLLNILYKQKGTNIMEERIVEPKYLDGDFLIAYCTYRKGTRRFNIYTLVIKQILLNNR